ncbi:MAG: hypothetical protein IPF83_01100 [Rhodanobacteraceae bacterium]|mgnify:CR=1 FL=1|nr:hypothetical protein [Rhodanobacteraceae bacterium]MBK7043010.1 hypothetical protein [Rhodanobacteraceae bacterium]
MLSIRWHQWVFVLLVALAAGCSDAKNLYVYSMVAKTVGETTIAEVSVKSELPRFAHIWGGLAKGGWKQYSDVEPREALSSGIVSWRLNGKKVEVPFLIDPPPAEMVERIRTSGVEVNGFVDHSELQLMFEINPDESSARVFWYESKFPPLSPPKS